MKKILQLKYWLEKEFRKISLYIIKSAPIIGALVLCASYEIGVHMDKEAYYDIAVYLYDSVSSSILAGVWLLAICSWHKLCLYNWLCSHLVIITGLFNIICKYTLDETDFYFYAELYSIIIIPFSLLMISIAFTQRKKRKRNVRQFN